jgi:hypothetical protein
MSRRLTTLCRNPHCSQPLTPVKRKSNKTGHSMYCKRSCYHHWSPGMEEAFFRLRKANAFGYEVGVDPFVFLSRVIRFLNKNYKTWTTRARIMGVSRMTYIKWVKHFASEGGEMVRRS